MNTVQQHELDLADGEHSVDGPEPPTQTSTSGPIAVVRDIVVGVGTMAIGLLGLILPVLPGWILIFVGALILAGRIPFLRRGLSRLLSSATAQRIVHRLTDAPASRRLLTRVLSRQITRRALETPVRWGLLRRVLQSEAREPSESDNRRDHDADR